MNQEFKVGDVITLRGVIVWNSDNLILEFEDGVLYNFPKDFLKYGELISAGSEEDTARIMAKWKGTGME